MLEPTVICTDAYLGLLDIPSESVDLVLTSPPYDDLRSYEDVTAWTVEKFEQVAQEIGRVLKQGGVCVWIVGDQTVKGSETGSSFRQALYFKDTVGLRLHDTMIWQKPNFSNPSSTRYHQVFEYMFVLSKGAPKTFNPISDRPNIYAGQKGSQGLNTVTKRDGSKAVRPEKVNREFGMRHNVWLMKTAGQDRSSVKWQHPAMFTEELASGHIASWTDENDLVLDPFCGSGTTCVSARMLNRRSIGFEVNPNYYNIIQQRLGEDHER